MSRAVGGARGRDGGPQAAGELLCGLTTADLRYPHLPRRRASHSRPPFWSALSKNFAAYS